MLTLPVLKPFLPDQKETTKEEASLIEKLRSRPIADKDAWKVYADWLEEKGRSLESLLAREKAGEAELQFFLEQKGKEGVFLIGPTTILDRINDWLHKEFDDDLNCWKVENPRFKEGGKQSRMKLAGAVEFRLVIQAIYKRRAMVIPLIGLPSSEHATPAELDLKKALVPVLR